MDRVFIKGLKADSVIGVYEWERKIRQTLVLDLELGTDITAASATDDLEKTLDYEAISNRVVGFIQAGEFQLVETLAEELARLLMMEFAIPWLKITLAKPGAVKDAESVGVMIERGIWN